MAGFWLGVAFVLYKSAGSLKIIGVTVLLCIHVYEHLSCLQRHSRHSSQCQVSPSHIVRFSIRYWHLTINHYHTTAHDVFDPSDYLVLGNLFFSSKFIFCPKSTSPLCTILQVQYLLFCFFSQKSVSPGQSFTDVSPLAFARIHKFWEDFWKAVCIHATWGLSWPSLASTRLGPARRISAQKVSSTNSVRCWLATLHL